jgi:uncharacterized protein YodC (DUF2158 family)
MDAREIVAGSVVQLKSGGPLMTVQQVADHWGTLTAWCDWFVQDNAHGKKRMEHFPSRH